MAEPNDNPNPNPQDNSGPVWRSTVEEGIRGEKSLDVFKGNTWDEVGPTIAKSYVESQKLIGGSVRIPKDDAKPEEWDSFFGKLGRPTRPDEYKITLPYEEYVNWNTDQMQVFKEAAHKAGYTNRQIQAAIDVYGKWIADGYQAAKAAREKADADLKAEWGGAYNQNMAMAKRFRDLYFPPAIKDFFEKHPEIANHPDLVRGFAKAGFDLNEGEFLGGPGESHAGVTAEEARSKITEVMKNPEDLYHAKFYGKPGHEERVKEVQGWYEIAYNPV